MLGNKAFRHYSFREHRPSKVFNFYALVFSANSFLTSTEKLLCTDLVQSANSLLAFDVVLIVSKYFKPAKKTQRTQTTVLWTFNFFFWCAKNSERKTENWNDHSGMKQQNSIMLLIHMQKHSAFDASSHATKNLFARKKFVLTGHDSLACWRCPWRGLADWDWKILPKFDQWLAWALGCGCNTQQHCTWKAQLFLVNIF